MGYHLAPKARADLGGIWDYTARRWSADQADLYVRQIAQTCADLDSDAIKGRSADDIRAGYFKLLVGSHIIFYRRREDGVEIIRVLHQRMDIQKHL